MLHPLRGHNLMNPRSNTAEEIYSILKKRILHLEYKPGFALSALTLSKEMQVSRSPAREALIKLSADNLVEIFPQVGTRVSLINLKKVSEERFLRKSLEESALKVFINKYSKQDIKDMKSLIKKQSAVLKQKDFLAFVLLDDEFHKTIFRAIDKPQCWSLMNNFGSNEFRIRLLSLPSVNKTTEAVVDSHTKILEAIESRDEKLALEISNHHLSRISDEIPKLLEIFPEIFSGGDIGENSRFQRNSSNMDKNFLNSL